MRPSPSKVRSLLRYDKKTGLFQWKNPGPKQPRGWFAGTKGVRDYRRILFAGGKTILAHIVAYAIVEGRWPDDDLDHKNRRQSDNRWKNIRPLGRRRNSFNRSLNKNSTTGFRGVSRFGKRFRASLRIDRRYVSIGLFDDPESAAIAWTKVAREQYGDAYVP